MFFFENEDLGSGVGRRMGGWLFAGLPVVAKAGGTCRKTSSTKRLRKFTISQPNSPEAIFS